ncbi:MAG: SDR family oxidoreductase [Nitrospira sp.]|nr:MAG: SDR family oxidoreductase [Nitrospira sp.]
MNRLAGKVALITGGGTGIGQAIAERFAKEGAAVVVTGRRKDKLDPVVHAIERSHGRALAVAGTVTDEAHVRSAVEQTLRDFGTLNVLVNNAAIGAFGKVMHEIDDATWDEVLAINLTGLFRMTRAAVPELIRAGGGSIVNISSVGGLIGFPMSAAYGATKGAMNAFTRCIAMDYAAQGIRCNAICPGLVETPMAEGLLQDDSRIAGVLDAYPIRRVGTPDEVAWQAVYLASDESTWVTGSLFPIDGGLTAH